MRTAEQAAHGVYRATVEPLLAACVDNSIYFEPLELRKLLANAMGVAMQSVPEKDLHRMLRTVVMESNRETWKEVRSWLVSGWICVLVSDTFLHDIYSEQCSGASQNAFNHISPAL